MSGSGWARAGMIAAIGVVICFSASSDGSFAASQSAQRVTHQSVLVDQQDLTLDLQPAAGAPEIDQNQALTLAKADLAGSSLATSIDSRYGLLTFRDANGNVVGRVQDRPVWMVTFRGVSYVPRGSSNTVCSCNTAYERPNSTVTIDARNGALINVFGTGR